MKNIKILGIITILAVALTACKGNNQAKEKVPVETTAKVEETLPKETKAAIVDNSVQERTMSKDDIEDLMDLLEDTGELEDKELNDELELVELAEEWITELAEININLEEIKQYTNDWLARERENHVSRFKEAFPKLNEYAVGLINDENILDLYRRTDDDMDERLDDRIVTEEQWTEVYNTIMSTIS